MTIPNGAKEAYEQVLQDVIDMQWTKMQGLDGPTWQQDYDALLAKVTNYSEMQAYQATLAQSQSQE